MTASSSTGPKGMARFEGAGFDQTGVHVVDVFVGYFRRQLEMEGEPRILQTVPGVGFTIDSEPILGTTEEG
jgi:DNA-binding response OmpR family regulator